MFDYKYSKNLNDVKHFYNENELFSIWMYFKI